LAFCSHARRLTKPGFPEVFDLKVDTENGLAAGLLTSPPASRLGQDGSPTSSRTFSTQSVGS